MKAIGYKQAGPIDVADSLVEIEAETPDLKSHDLLVEVHGILVNPVDVKVRQNQQPDCGIKIIGYDAADVVQQAGRKVSEFKVRDEVFTPAISRDRARRKQP